MCETKQGGLESRGSDGSIDTLCVRKEDRVGARCRLVDRFDGGKMREFLFACFHFLSEV